LKLEKLDPENINKKFKHKNLLVPAKGLTNNILKKKEFRVSKPYDKSPSVNHSSKPSINDSSNNYNGLMVHNDIKSKDKVNTY